MKIHQAIAQIGQNHKGNLDHRGGILQGLDAGGQPQHDQLKNSIPPGHQTGVGDRPGIAQRVKQALWGAE